MDLEIEFILGERWPTPTEYQEWLQSEEDRKNPDKEKIEVDILPDASNTDKKKQD